MYICMHVVLIFLALLYGNILFSLNIWKYTAYYYTTSTNRDWIFNFE